MRVELELGALNTFKGDAEIAVKLLGVLGNQTVHMVTGDARVKTGAHIALLILAHALEAKADVVRIHTSGDDLTAAPSLADLPTFEALA